MTLRRNADILGYALIVGSVLLQSCALACFKQAGLSGSHQGVLGLVVNLWYVLGLAMLASQAVLWMATLRRFELSFAYPFMSLVFPVNLILAALAFHEMIRPGHVVGTLLILAGVVVLARETAADQ